MIIWSAPIGSDPDRYGRKLTSVVHPACHGPKADVAKRVARVKFAKYPQKLDHKRNDR
jgi:hypothetical protein